MFFVIDLFMAVGSILKLLVLGLILYFLSTFGSVYVFLFLILAAGLFFTYLGLSAGSPTFMLFSSCFTFHLMILAILEECYKFSHTGWPLSGRGGLLLIGITVLLTFILRRLKTLPWRFFSNLADIKD